MFFASKLIFIVMIFVLKNSCKLSLISLVNDTIKINEDTIKLPYSNMAIAQNYLAAYSVSMTFGINRVDIIEELENTPVYPGRGELIIKNNIM